MYAGGHRTGLIDAQLYGVYDVPSNQEVTIEYGWRESNLLKRQAETVPPGIFEQTFRIDTGSTIRDEFIRLVAE
jgi:hypothetical protein